MREPVASDSGEDNKRTVSLGSGLPAIPERLLLAHARGEVLFLCGAGISQSAGLPDFRELVLGVYQALDPSIHEILPCAPTSANCQPKPDYSKLTDRQAAEVKRFVDGDYDVVLGMLERRLDGRTRGDSKVRSRVAELLRSPSGSQVSATQMSAGGAGTANGTGVPPPIRPAPIHRALMRLADRGGATTIMTTNFDLLLEAAAKRLRVPVETYALGSIPRPTRRTEFAGVFHIHGALSRNPARFSDLVLSDQDFGEFYLRRRVVPDLIYDAARLFNLVLVGYSANDPPMRYLLNAVAADEARFDDLKDRFIFFGTDGADQVVLEDWTARGIVPIHYHVPDNDHSQLCDTLERWADLSPNSMKRRAVDIEVRRIVKTDRATASENDRKLLDHLFRRSNPGERNRLAALASAAGAEPGWLGAIMSIGAERDRERRS